MFHWKRSVVLSTLSAFDVAAVELGRCNPWSSMVLLRSGEGGISDLGQHTATSPFANAQVRTVAGGGLVLCIGGLRLAAAHVGPGARAERLGCDFSAGNGWAAETCIAKLHAAGLATGSIS